MKLKSYFAPTVEAAIAMAAKELGEDALLVYAREATPETKYLGKHEVVFAGGGEREPAPGPAPASAPPDPPLRAQDADRWKLLEDHIERLRGQIERQGSRLESVLSQAQSTGSRREDTPPSPGRVLEGGMPLAARLGAFDIPWEMCRDVAQAAAGAGPEGGDDALLDQMAARISADPGIAGRPGAGVVIVAGPPGAGKTSLVVKMAGRQILAGAPAPDLVSFGESRVAEARELEAYARLLGANYSRVGDPVGWRPAARSLTLVDSPGYCGGPEEEETAAALEHLAARGGAELHLALNASMRTVDLEKTVARFRRFAPARLAFTRLDETSIYGPIWAIARKTGIPVSFLSGGRRIPEDLTAPDPRGIAALALGRAAARSPAPKALAAAAQQ